MDDTFIFQVEFPFGGDILAAVVRMKDMKFLSSLTFNFFVLHFERCKHVTFLVEISDPRVA